VHSSSDAAGKSVATDFFIEVVIEPVIEKVSSVLIECGSFAEFPYILLLNGFRESFGWKDWKHIASGAIVPRSYAGHGMPCPYCGKTNGGLLVVAALE
jgi:hypothetical protein